MHTSINSLCLCNMGLNECFNNIPPLALHTSGDTKTSETIRSYCTNFAKTGDPNYRNGSLLYWPSYTGYGITKITFAKAVWL
ncbi:hypothetical protein V8C42DRAFT_336398, partial [Trichoderma barbatum]